jgi:hypothetical protein
MEMNPASTVFRAGEGNDQLNRELPQFYLPTSMWKNFVAEPLAVTRWSPVFRRTQFDCHCFGLVNSFNVFVLVLYLRKQRLMVAESCRNM